MISIGVRWVGAAPQQYGFGERETVQMTGVDVVVIQDMNRFKEGSSIQWEKATRGNDRSKFVTLNSFTDAASKT